MTGSDNVCYVVQNQRLTGFDPDIISTKLQPARASEGAHAVRLCVACTAPLTARQKRTCSHRCAALLNVGTLRSFQGNGAANGHWKGGISASHVRYTRAFKQQHPDIARAHRLVAAAVRSGQLVRPQDCASCLRRTRVDAHHADYTKPLSVEWLCRKCHVAADRLRQQREAAPATAQQANRDLDIKDGAKQFSHDRQSATSAAIHLRQASSR